MQVIGSAPNTFTEASFNTPNLTEAGFVMEILRIYYELEGVLDLGPDNRIEYGIWENSRPLMPNLNDSGVINKQKIHATLLTEGANSTYETPDVAFTDGAGNGLLTGRKEIFIGVEGVAQTNAITVNAAILYRLVRVTPGELVGLIST
jgi:hypothetical protein